MTTSVASPQVDPNLGSHPGHSIAELIRARESVEVIAKAFDSLDHARRVERMYQLSKQDQARLFEMCTGRAATLKNDFVGENKPPLTEVIHWGINSLPTFRKFQKRFAWSAANPGSVVGYNEQTMKTFTGPGYFVAREGLVDGKGPTVVVDYTLLPKEKCAGWPTILTNQARLSVVIYNGTMDWMWKVSRHVTIGRASRAGKWMDNWFVLCRED